LCPENEGVGLSATLVAINQNRECQISEDRSQININRREKPRSHKVGGLVWEGIMITCVHTLSQTVLM